jgi:hypothetical protein
MYSSRRVRARVLVAVLTIMVGALLPGTAVAAGRSSDGLRADLDGYPIKLAEVGKHYCHDFDYPVVHCFSKASDLERTESVSTAAAAAGVQYVTAYDYTGFQGSYMHFSQNYTVLAWIGWNDRISSFVVHNGQSGNFYWDWYYGGASYGWCCNQQFTGLGAWDNAFSSVYRF